jgi:transposase
MTAVRPAPVARDSTLKTARAWAIKELAMSLWRYVSKTWASKGWEKRMSWAVRSRGFRNKKRFANAIYSQLGVLDLYPEGVVR